MASVSVLYIADSVVGPHLELLRNICEPHSGSRPHVTVRYFEKLSVPPEHLSTRVSHIDVISPGSFGLEDEWRQSNRTVYLRCESDELLALEHKPHFPASFFHITLYDGRSTNFARSLLDLVKCFKWGFRVPLPEGTTLEEIKLKPRKARKSAKSGRRRPYRPEVRELFQEITSSQLTRHFSEHLSDHQRLELAYEICKHLHAAVDEFERIAEVHSVPIQGEAGAGSFRDDGEVHLTPPELAQEVAQYAVDLLPPGAEVHFGDPAVGTGAFYAALLQVLPHGRLASAIGIDINVQQVEAARSRWSRRGMDVKLGDYLHMERQAPRTLILANPPYRRHQNILEKDKQALCERASVELGIQVSGRAGLYVYFLLLTHKWMAPGAVAAWLIPSEFMQTNYGQAVRYYLTHRVQLVRVHKFDYREPQFESAEVLPAVVVFKNSEPSPDDEVLMSTGGTLNSPRYCESVTVKDLQSEWKWIVPGRKEANGTTLEIRIGDLFSVRRGIATGANDFFILTRAEAEALGIPALALRPVLPKVRALPDEVIEREADGFPALNKQLCLIDCSLSEEEIKARFPGFASYLAKAEKLGLLNRNLVRRRKPWYRQEQREPARFLCTYMGRGKGDVPPIRFLLNKSDAVVTNTYLMLYPRPGLAQRLLGNPLLEKEVFELLKGAARNTMRYIWRIHAGGLFKIEPRELLQVPLPIVPPWLEDIIDPRI